MRHVTPDLPPLLAEIATAIRTDMSHERRLAASGLPGCVAARRRMQRLNLDLLKLELGKPLR